MRFSNVAMLMITVAALASSDAHAAPTENFWSSTGGGCVPIDTAIQGNRYSIGAGGLKFYSTYTGQFTAVCPIKRNTGTSHQPNSMWLSYQDNNSLSTTKVEVKLEKMSLANGAITQIGSILSSQSGSTGDGRVWEYFTHTFDWENYAYFIYVDIYRATTSDSAILYAVTLDYTP